MFIEDERGGIREGKYADFILIDKEVLSFFMALRA